MQVTLIKKWLNHEPGTIVKSVSPAILAELKKLGAVEDPEKVIFKLDDIKPEPEPEPEKEESKKKALKTSAANKMISQSEKIKTEDSEA